MTRTGGMSPPGGRLPLALVALILATVATVLAAHADDALEHRPAPTAPHLPVPWAATEPATSRSFAVYPPQHLPLTFSHAAHVAPPTAMDCTDCHASATASTRTADRLLPPMTRCLDCHVLPGDAATMAPDQRPAECATCHPGYEGAPPRLPPELDVALGESTYRLVLDPPPVPDIPAANLHFSHALHATAGVTCVECHGDMRDVGLATRQQLPTMADCLDCHAERGVAGQDLAVTASDCASCHLTGAHGRLLTMFDSGALAPTGRFRNDDHRFDFIERHAEPASTEPALCETCHSQSECLDCHNGVLKPMAIHPPNYVQLHGIDAAQADDCSSCHTLSSFCVGCHEETGVGDLTRPWIEARFHPDGFVDDPSSAWFHGPEAQINMSSCVSCHQEDTCVRCHAGINPHPPDFASTCGAMIDRNANACAACHTDIAAIRAQCR